MHRLLTKTFVFWLVWSLAWGFSLAPAVAQNEVGNPEAEALIRQLDANQYETRMAATRDLVALGEQAIGPLIAALTAQPGLEVQSRGLEVLERLARNEAELRGGLAHEALRQIAAGPEGSLRQRAAAKLEQLKVHRRDLALERLKSAGAEIRMGLMQPAVGGPAILGVTQIEIGETWKGTAEDIQWLALAGDVRSIIFDGPLVTNDYLRPLAALDSVQMADIKRASVDDEGIAILTSLSRCDALGILHTPLTDAAINDLARIPTAVLKLYGTEITEQGHQKLAQMLPAFCTLDFRRGGFLGVGPSLGPADGFHLGEVQPNSAAQTAGLRQGDVITKYDGVEVRHFDQIRDLIAKNEVGAKVEIEYVRRGKKYKTTATLGEWP
jgi:hypothetical protein